MTEAFTILGYYEHLTEDDVPPEEMWGNDDALAEWFEEVKIRHKSADTPSERIPEPEEPQQGFTHNTLIDELGLR